MKTLFWIALAMIIVGFAGLLALPGAYLTRAVVYALVGSASLGCIIMIWFGPKLKVES